MALSEEGHKLDQERHPTAALLLRGARGSSGRVNRRPTADSKAGSRAGKGHLNIVFFIPNCLVQPRGMEPLQTRAHLGLSRSWWEPPL